MAEVKSGLEIKLLLQKDNLSRQIIEYKEAIKIETDHDVKAFFEEIAEDKVLLYANVMRNIKKLDAAISKATKVAEEVEASLMLDQSVIVERENHASRKRKVKTYKKSLF